MIYDIIINTILATGFIGVFLFLVWFMGRGKK